MKRGPFLRLLIATSMAAVMMMVLGNPFGAAQNDKTPEPTKENASNKGEKSAAQPAEEGVKVGTLLEQLEFPTSLAVRPGSSRGQIEIWVADAAAQQVVRYQSETPDKWGEAIVELEASTEAEAEEGATAAEGRPAPLALMFHSRNRLMLASAGAQPLRVFDVGDDKLPKKGADAEGDETSPEQSAGPLATIARNPDFFYLLNSEGNAISRAPIKGAQIGDIQKYRAATQGVESSNPRAMAFSSKGYMVVGYAGDETSESLLVFLDPGRAESPPVMILKTGLPDIAALAYHPKSGSLYAADSAWGDAAQGGIYRLDAKPVDNGGNEECQAVLIAKIPYATALEFDSQGTLYVVSTGVTTPGDQPQGKLIKITGQL